MQTSNLNKYVVMFLVVLLGCSGWITSAFVYNEINSQDDYYKHVSISNAENIVTQALNGIDSYDGVASEIKKWRDRGATAQTGSIETICKYNESFFSDTFTNFTTTMAKNICNI